MSSGARKLLWATEVLILVLSLLAWPLPSTSLLSSFPLWSTTLVLCLFKPPASLVISSQKVDMVPCQSRFPNQSSFLPVLVPHSPKDAPNPHITAHPCCPTLTPGAPWLPSVLQATSVPYFKEAFVRKASPKEQTIDSTHNGATNGAMSL